jgi:hypothetical protein
MAVWPYEQTILRALRSFIEFYRQNAINKQPATLSILRLFENKCRLCQQVVTGATYRHLLEDRGKPRKLVSRWPMRDLPDAYRLLASSPTNKTIQKSPEISQNLCRIRFLDVTARRARSGWSCPSCHFCSIPDNEDRGTNILRNVGNSSPINKVRHP